VLASEESFLRPTRLGNVYTEFHAAAKWLWHAHASLP
jgi:hypothetical protein